MDIVPFIWDGSAPRHRPRWHILVRGADLSPPTLLLVHARQGGCRKDAERRPGLTVATVSGPFSLSLLRRHHRHHRHHLGLVRPQLVSGPARMMAG